MRTRSFAALLGIAAMAVMACSTTDSRIRSQQDLFDSYPPEVQQNIRNGIIEVGYTPEMVVMALGEPNHKEVTELEDGLAEVWTYSKSVPGFGIGMGTGGYAGGGVGIGTGVTMGEPARREDRAVVQFSNGRVKHFETPGSD
jgi:hypothetical protein